MCFTPLIPHQYPNDYNLLFIHFFYSFVKFNFCKDWLNRIIVIDHYCILILDKTEIDSHIQVQIQIIIELFKYYFFFFLCFTKIQMKIFIFFNKKETVLSEHVAHFTWS